MLKVSKLHHMTTEYIKMPRPHLNVTDTNWIRPETAIASLTNQPIKKFSHFLLCVQVLGEKPELPDTHGDDTKVDASHRKQARLYKVNTGRWMFSFLCWTMSSKPRLQQVLPRLSICPSGVQCRG